jgi:hypothetical protein
VFNLIISESEQLKGKIEALHKTIQQLESTLTEEGPPSATDTLRVKLQACLGQITSVLSEMGDAAGHTDERDWLQQKKTLLELRSFGMHSSSHRVLTFNRQRRTTRQKLWSEEKVRELV